MADLEGKLRELAEELKEAHEAYGRLCNSLEAAGDRADKSFALGRAEGLSDALKIIREYTYLDGRAGEMANLLEDRIEAIRVK